MTGGEVGKGFVQYYHHCDITVKFVGKVVGMTEGKGLLLVVKVNCLESLPCTADCVDSLGNEANPADNVGANQLISEANCCQLVSRCQLCQHA